MPRCPRCGEIVEETDKYCSYCGLWLEAYRFEKFRDLRGKTTERKIYLLVATIIAIVILATAAGYAIWWFRVHQSQTPLEESVATSEIVTYPDIRVVEVNAKSYIAGLDVRAKVTAVLYNYGTADGYAIVKLYTKWDTTRDESIQSVFVPVGQYVTVQADLDIPALSTWTYNAQIVSQRRA